VIAFDSLEKAQARYESAAYQEIKPIRLKAAKSRAFVVEGLPAWDDRIWQISEA
jgi:uncharacterized protein (DUF1330 family)